MQRVSNLFKSSSQANRPYQGMDPSVLGTSSSLLKEPASRREKNQRQRVRKPNVNFQLFHRLGKPKYASASPPPSQASRNEKSPTILGEAAVVVSTHQCVVASTGAPLRRGPFSNSREQDVQRDKARRLNSNGSSSPAPNKEQCRGIIRAAEQQRKRILGAVI